MAKIEFYIGTAPKHIAVVVDEAVPREGELVNIRKSNYRVGRVTWAVDHGNDVLTAQLRANVELEEL